MCYSYHLSSFLVPVVKKKTSSSRRKSQKHASKSMQSLVISTPISIYLSIQIFHTYIYIYIPLAKKLVRYSPLFSLSPTQIRRDREKQSEREREFFPIVSVCVCQTGSEPSTTTIRKKKKTNKMRSWIINTYKGDVPKQLE